MASPVPDAAGAGGEDGRRLTRKGQATRARIVAAAAGLMYARGVAGTSTEDVRVAASVSSSQLYHYFADKNALVRAVVAYQTEAVLSFQQPQFSRLDSLAGLAAWADTLVDLHLRLRGGCPLGSLASELADADPVAREALVAAFARWEAAIRDGLAAMRARGELRGEADPDRLAVTLLAAVQGGLLLAQTRREVAPLRIALDTVLDHIRSLVSDAVRPYPVGSASAVVTSGVPVRVERH
ncbi:TetR/AcrR family transcriptional regulator [Frankia gtarii]|uniref:TetR/AcrR family transcriptional regulator n=1 Tax=Frankia gtarii TaxID=2950102 RepID=UPI0021BFA099|nr:TetR/AcrR family transcriptional regulator [Frankia gtarii]